MFRSIVLILVYFAALATSTLCQDPTASPSAEPRKANARPAATPEPPAAEPFDRADAKTMASKCVELNTESGIVDINFIRNAPEVRILTLCRSVRMACNTFSRVVPGFVIRASLATRKLADPGDSTWSCTIPDRPTRSFTSEASCNNGAARPNKPRHFYSRWRREIWMESLRLWSRNGGMEVVDNINKMAVIGDKPRSLSD